MPKTFSLRKTPFFLAALLLSAIVIGSVLIQDAKATSGVFGKTTIGGSLYEVGDGQKLAVFAKYTLADNANVTNISVYCNGTANGLELLKVALYNTSYYLLDNSLVSSFVNITSVTPQWYNFSIIANVIVPPGTYYLAALFKGVSTSNALFWFDSVSTGNGNYKWGVNDFASPMTSVNAYSYGLSIYANYTIADVDSPTFSSISSTETLAGNNTGITCNISDNIAVSGYIFSWNNTGSFANQTWVSGASVNFTGTLNATVAATVSVKLYANDTSNNWAASSQYNLTTTENVISYTVSLAYTPTGTVLVTERIVFTLSIVGNDSSTLTGYIVNVTRNSGMFREGYTESTFDYTDESAGSQIFSVSGLADNSGNELLYSVTPVTALWSDPAGPNSQGGVPTDPTLSPNSDASPSPLPLGVVLPGDDVSGYIIAFAVVAVVVCVVAYAKGSKTSHRRARQQLLKKTRRRKPVF